MDSAMCERTRKSPAKYPPMVHQQRGTGGGEGARAGALARHPEVQQRGPEMENQPPSLLSTTADPRACTQPLSQRGGRGVMAHTYTQSHGCSNLA